MTATTGSDRPRSTAEIVDAAIQLVRHHYLSLITVAAIGYVPFTVVQLTAFRQVMAAAGAGTILAVLTSSATQAVTYYTFTLLWSALIDLTLTVAVSDAYGGRPIDIADVFRRALPHAAATVGATILKYVSIGVAGALCIGAMIGVDRLALPSPGRALLYVILISAFLPCVAYPIGLFFATTAAVALENAGPYAALLRSAHLSRGRIGHVLGGLALAYGIYFLGLFPVFLVAARGDRTVAHFLSVGATILLFPVLTATRVILYYDARIRTEGYDIELMAQRVAAAGVSLPSN